MPSPAPRIRTLSLVCLVLAVLALGCDDDGNVGAEEDLIVVDDTADTASADTNAPADTGADAADTAPTDTVAPTDTASSDTTPVDTATDLDTDTGDPCETATLDAACAVEGSTCGECGPTSCTFCNLLYCTGGTWQRIEAHPDPMCHLQACSPLDASTCEPGEGCYWDPDLGVFGCLPAGTIEPEDGCSAPGDCVAGALCVQRGGTSAPQCYVACDPETDDGICGGPCDSLGEHGYDNGAGTRVHDVGFCYFLGG